MKKSIFIAICVLVCSSSSISAADPLQPNTEVSDNGTLPVRETAVAEPQTKGDATIIKSKLDYLKEMPQNAYIAGQELAAQIFRKDTLLYISVSIGYICYVTLSLTCKILLGVLQLIQWGITKVGSLAR